MIKCLEFDRNIALLDDFQKCFGVTPSVIYGIMGVSSLSKVFEVLKEVFYRPLVKRAQIR